jgi:2-keto-4-pentenoate hydratase/2-oxohepta-3-ene-1,7-dioic acid hydratase in catechol pathway
VRLARFFFDNEFRTGVIEDDQIHSISGSFYTGFEIGAEQIPCSEIKLLSPVEPSKILAVGLNYIDHAHELKMPIPEEPLLFMKPSTSVIGPGEMIVYPNMSRQVDYEAELGVIIKKVTKQVDEVEAKEYILGYTCANDVTARDLQKKDGQWTRSKGFDTFSPLGPWIETALDPLDVTVESYLNGELKQSSSTRNMIFDVYKLVSHISKVMTLLPGDVIMTGTPFGVGPMETGDKIDISIEGIGVLSNYVGPG